MICFFTVSDMTLGVLVASRRCFDDNAHYNSEYFDRDNAKIINSCEYNSDRGSFRFTSFVCCHARYSV